MCSLKNKYLKIFSIIFVAISLSACSTEQKYLVNLTFVKHAIMNYHDSGKYDKDVSEVIKKAEKEFDEITPAKNSAVVFDVDETVLSNYKFEKENDFGYVEKYWNMWVDSAKAPAITGVQGLYNYLVKRRFKIIFLTGRKDFQYEVTRKNLIDAGYTKFDTLIVRQKKYYSMTALEYKSDERTQLVKAGYKIDGTVGDQWSDLNGPYHGVQVKIPDYQYFIE